MENATVAIAASVFIGNAIVFFGLLAIPQWP
jgi:hypothetical protein